MEIPEITVVIPTINRPRKVITAIDSLDKQTYKGNIYCVVVDSSENNETKNLIDKQVLKKENLYIKYIKNNNSTRPIDNWIIGIEEFKTEYGKFLCDDDWLDQTYLEKCVNIMIAEKIDSVITDISVIKENGNSKENYYKVQQGPISKEKVVNSLLGIESMVPVTPTANLMKSEKLIESFYESLKHIECTKNLFGFDFYISYYSVFKGKGTYLINESLSFSFAGDDSMTLNVKKAMISYCYLFALINLIESSGFIPNIDQKKGIEHKLATFKIKSFFSREYSKLKYSHSFNSKLNLYKLIVSQLKKYFIKIIYKINN
ncbi:MAG: hypothetical protein CBD76_00345 [Pelagibacteraceae bacterium TMED216]|nr:MAG: hypothetical protein CBD76_00345 [Pelagibacteraceae bacterium TMED216]|tara:strand:+ start:145 stop:1095 length:951 start_codon:yes stop_codon:yes gene_type:complete